MSQEPEAFVIIPFTPEFDKIYNKVIEPTLEELGYSVSKADSTDSQQNILRDVIGGISSADLLIADLTNSNANVFYEAGIAHTLGVPTVLVTQSIDSVPFDLQAYHLIEYSVRFDDMEEFRSELENIGAGHLEGKIEFGNPVADFGDIEIQGQVEQDAITEDGGESEDDETDQGTDSSSEVEKGILDYAAEAEFVQNRFIQSVLSITDKTETLESNLLKHANQIEQISESGGQFPPARAQSIAKRAAGDMREYVNSTTDDSKSMKESLDTMIEAQEKSINFADPAVEEHQQALRRRQDDLVEFRQSTGAAIEGLQDFRSEAIGIKGVSRELNKAAGELADLLSTLISTLSSADARAERMIQLTDEKLGNKSAFAN